MYKVFDLLDAQEIVQLKEIAARAQFVHGRISNPHHPAKENEQIFDQAAYQQSAKILSQALSEHEDFRNFSFPAAVAPPMLTRYTPGMRYGAHADNAYLYLPNAVIRSDLSCTIFLNEPESYEGGALHIQLGDGHMRFKLNPGQAIVYPSDTMHEVEAVTKGERLVAITFIQSRVADPFKRSLLYNLNEVAALEGLKMTHENYTMMQLIQNQLLRHWGEKP